ncbi:MAG TPA: hypothetical protein DF774_14225 [Rheinheimera sp.]|nr:hypothetical protein [Rheinheimera sp.]
MPAANYWQGLPVSYRLYSTNHCASALNYRCTCCCSAVPAASSVQRHKKTSNTLVFFIRFTRAG